MKLLLEAIEKCRTEGLPALVLLAEQEKLLGSLPKDRSAFQNQAQSIVKNQASKVLNDSTEMFMAG